MFRDPAGANSFLIDHPSSGSEVDSSIAASRPTATFLGLGHFSLWITKVAVVEFISVGVAAYAAAAIYHNAIAPELFYAQRYALAALTIATLYLCACVAFQDYRKLQQQQYQRYIWSGLKSAAFALAFFLSGMFILKIADDYSRATFIFQIAGICLTVPAVRSLIFSRMRTAIAAGRLEGRRAILIGDPAYHAEIERRLQSFGVRTIKSLSFFQFDEPPLTGVRKMIDACRTLYPDDVLILAKPNDLSGISGLVDALARLPVAVHLVPVGIGDILTSARITGLGEVVTVQVIRPPLSAFDAFIKRLFDVVASLIGLIAFAPLFLVVALAIKFDTPGPVFFRQERHGYNNRRILVFKFRSMTPASFGSEFKQTQRNDPRVTRVGRFIRRTSIDELPQLLNVIRGEMSIVGPRPHATAHNEMFEDRISPLSRRHNVKPGITGWAQVNRSRGETETLEKMQKRIDLDLYYVDNWSFMFDMKIVIMTCLLLFSKREYLDAY